MNKKNEAIPVMSADQVRPAHAITPEPIIVASSFLKLCISDQLYQLFMICRKQYNKTHFTKSVKIFYVYFILSRVQSQETKWDNIEVCQKYTYAQIIIQKGSLFE